MPDPQPDLTLPEVYQVRRVERETADTVTLELAPAAGGPALAYAPGQFNMLYVYGNGEVPISISGDPADGSQLVHTTRAVGAVSAAITRLARGQRLGVRGPFGTRWPLEETAGSDVLFVAGGIGLAPLRPALYHVLAHRERYGKVVLLYGARTPADVLYRRQLARWRARRDLEVHVTVDQAAAGWTGDVGVVTMLLHRLRLDPQRLVALVVGPEVMMRFTLLELERRAVPLRRVYLSMERNMKCGVGLCGHCQLGPHFICKDGPVYRADQIRSLAAVREA
ncbi:MAG TPA: FAD/NAD(P)-binding protein [Candidatus Saccharimonadales bacterium]|nr:FAD/NAD(P)-binding protein [Candidatus Saccharimonadales bacterium]